MDATSDAKPIVPERIRPFRRLMGAFGDRMPKGLYARALIIIIAPMVLLQSVLTFVFLERHWQTVTRRLSTVTVQNINMLMDLYQTNRVRIRTPTLLTRLAEQNLGLKFVVRESCASAQAFFDLLDTTLLRADQQIGSRSDRHARLCDDK